ncbi:MAG: penicillin-binding transpeptidase domain-containing protein [Chthoniobacterales bacterium]
MNQIYSATLFFLLLLPVSLAAESSLLENPKPTWETQCDSQSFYFSIPAPRGQITDCHGDALAQNCLSFNLALQFPTPLHFTDAQALSFAKQYITFAQGLLKNPINLSDKTILKHYHRRGLLPLDLIEDLSPAQLAVARRGLPECLIIRQTYTRFYPEGTLACHIIGYTGRTAPLSVRAVENKDLIFPESEGREGIEQGFDDQLKGHPGSLSTTYDENGKKNSERITQRPVPGNNVVTTLDKNIQRLCEKVLHENCKQGAIVFLDPNNGEIKAMASYPGFNPNDFVPTLSPQIFEKLNQDPSVPLLPRAFRSAYPPGSSFKIVVGIAALQEGIITPQDTFRGPASFAVGNFVFHNWKKTDVGKLNFVQAFTQSCNTWFYQCGLKMKAGPIITWAHHLGLGHRTGIPLKGEAQGNIPNDDYMLCLHHRKILPGDIANMSIGQGDILITPLQMAQMAGIVAAEGKFHQTRLIQQIQTPDNKVIAAYPDRIRADLQLTPEVVATLREAMIDVTEDAQGTAHRAQVDGIHVAGKSGTAQWGPPNKQRTAAWFTGFVPADHPQYAFAAVYEGDPGDNSIHGGSHAAPLIGKVLREIYGKNKKEETQDQVAPSKKNPGEQPSEEDNSTGD